MAYVRRPRPSVIPPKQIKVDNKHIKQASGKPNNRVTGRAARLKQ